MITKSQRAIAYFLLACQLLSSCGGKQEMIIPNTFLNDHQQNCVAKEEYKSPISSIQEAKASAVTNQVHEEVTLRSSSTFFPASQPVCNGRVDARLKMKNTSSTHNRMASKPFTISTWQKIALFSIALNNTFACASRPYAFNKEPKQHQISSEREDVASTASTDQVQPKTIEDNLQIPTSQEQEKHRPVFVRAKNAKKYAFVNETSAGGNVTLKNKNQTVSKDIFRKTTPDLETWFLNVLKLPSIPKILINTVIGSSSLRVFCFLMIEQLSNYCRNMREKIVETLLKNLNMLCRRKLELDLFCQLSSVH